jgi:hypothetical protein
MSNHDAIIRVLSVGAQQLAIVHCWLSGLVRHPARPPRSV